MRRCATSPPATSSLRGSPCPPDAALRAAARQYGVRCSLLSDYDLTGTAHSAAGTLVLGYGSLPDADCAAAGERLKKLCTAAREASDTV